MTRIPTCTSCMTALTDGVPVEVEVHTIRAAHPVLAGGDYCSARCAVDDIAASIHQAQQSRPGDM